MKKNYNHIIKEQWDEGEEDGYWIHLKDGWEVDDCVVIHESTKKKALARLPDAILKNNSCNS